MHTFPKGRLYQAPYPHANATEAVSDPKVGSTSGRTRRHLLEKSKYHSVKCCNQSATYQDRRFDQINFNSYSAHRAFVFCLLVGQSWVVFRPKTCLKPRILENQGLPLCGGAGTERGEIFYGYCQDKHRSEVSHLGDINVDGLKCRNSVNLAR